MAELLELREGSELAWCVATRDGSCRSAPEKKVVTAELETQDLIQNAKVTVQEA